MFEIIVDSAANIPAELCKKYKIKVLSFVNLVNGKEMPFIAGVQRRTQETWYS